MAERMLYDSELVSVAEFRCSPQDGAWDAVNVIRSPSPLVVFPHRSVGIRPADGRPVLATPNLAMLYNPAQPYERELRDPRGDECIFVALHAPAIRALEGEGSIVRDGRMTQTHTPTDRVSYLRVQLLARHLRGDDPDPLLVEDLLLRLVRAVVGRSAQPAPRRTATWAEHHRLAESAKELISAAPEAAFGLHELATRLGVSPFHLARVFRRQTGFSLHQYRTQLRLRLALHRLPDSRGELTSLAFDLGFASHSHFTDTFRREFGVAPSAVRDAATVRQLLAA